MNIHTKATDPAIAVSPPVVVDVFRGRLEREVRRGEGDVQEERVAGVPLGVLLQVRDAVVGDRGRRAHRIQQRSPGGEAEHVP